MPRPGDVTGPGPPFRRAAVRHVLAAVLPGRSRGAGAMGRSQRARPHRERPAGRGRRSWGTMRTKKALAVPRKGEIWWAIRDSNPEPTD